MSEAIGNLVCYKIFNTSFSRHRVLIELFLFSGSTQKTMICGMTVCLFPRASCCGTYSKILDRVARTYTCGPVNNPTDPAIQPTTCCDPEGTGLWNEWSNFISSSFLETIALTNSGVWSNCSATCGKKFAFKLERLIDNNCRINFTGLCGTQTRTRTCASEAYGCPCT